MPPSNETASRFSTCMAAAFPDGPICGAPTTALLSLTCAAEHYRLVATCDEHTAAARELTRPGALASCALCEDLTGVDEPMTLAVIDPFIAQMTLTAMASAS